jgi:hypothetical protein
MVDVRKLLLRWQLQHLDRARVLCCPTVVKLSDGSTGQAKVCTLDIRSRNRPSHQLKAKGSLSLYKLRHSAISIAKKIMS